jgi:cystathionine beta-lyase
MADDQSIEAPGGQSLFTRLAQLGRAGTHVRGFVNPAVHRGSTVLSATTVERREYAGKRYEQELVYGIYGTPTHWPLETLIAEIEGGTRCQIVSSGLAAVTTPMLAYLDAGDHCLVTDSVYGPTRNFCDQMLRRLGIETTYYHPEATTESLAALFRPTTRVLYLESPGSHTFEVQDVPALAAAARARGAKVLMDNTWGLHSFRPFDHGVDVAIQALTKYAVGHSDVMLGGVTTANAEDWHRVRKATMLLGQFASPDDCWLTLRGLRTFAVRLERQMRSALEVAAWLAGRSEVLRVLYPPLPGAPGHAIWRRDFDGAASLFGIVLKPEFAAGAAEALVDALQLFGIGASWGGYESLALPTSITRTAGSGEFGGPMVRLHIGLEDPGDLIADLAQALAVMASRPR